MTTIATRTTIAARTRRTRRTRRTTRTRYDDGGENGDDADEVTDEGAHNACKLPATYLGHALQERLPMAKQTANFRSLTKMRLHGASLCGWLARSWRAPANLGQACLDCVAQRARPVCRECMTGVRTPSVCPMTAYSPDHGCIDNPGRYSDVWPTPGLCGLRGIATLRQSKSPKSSQLSQRRRPDPRARRRLSKANPRRLCETIHANPRCANIARAAAVVREATPLAAALGRPRRARHPRTRGPPGSHGAPEDGECCEAPKWKSGDCVGCGACRCHCLA